MHGLFRALSQSVIQRTWGNGVRDKDGDCVSLVMEANLWPESGICHQLLCDLSPPARFGIQPDEDMGRISCVIPTGHSLVIVLGAGVGYILTRTTKALSVGRYSLGCEQGLGKRFLVSGGLPPTGRLHPREAERWSRVGWLKVRIAWLTAPHSVLRPMNEETAKVIQTVFQRASYPDIKGMVGMRAMKLLVCIK